MDSWPGPRNRQQSIHLRRMRRLAECNKIQCKVKMADMRGVSALEEELARSKEILKGFDESIKKLTGRDPGETRPGQRRVVATGDNFGGGRGRLFAAARRSLGEPGGPPAKRRAVGGAFSRLGPRLGARQGRDSGGEEDEGNKPAVQSSVIATPKDTRTRQDMIKAQNKDPEGKARNRRMFGVLLGTLQSFQKDARVKDDKVQQRKAIEEKLEQKQVEERELIKKERQTLFNQRKKEQAKLRRLEQKMELVKIHKEWETQTKYLMNFARTKAKPHIYYQPKTHNSATEKKVKETAKVLEGVIEERRKQLEEEIEELTKKDQESKEEEKAEEEEEDEEEDEEEEDGGVRLKEEEENGSHERLGGEADVEGKEKGEEMDTTGEGEKVQEEEKENQREEEKGEEGGQSEVKKEILSQREAEKESRSKRHPDSEKKEKSKKRDRRDSHEEKKRSREKHRSESDRDRRSSRSEKKDHKRRHRSRSPAKPKDSDNVKDVKTEVAKESSTEDTAVETRMETRESHAQQEAVASPPEADTSTDHVEWGQGELPTELPPEKIPGLD